jgi:hypothetical protein
MGINHKNVDEIICAFKVNIKDPGSMKAVWVYILGYFG